MVGHTGILAAAVAAMETVDACAGRVVDAVLAAGGCALLHRRPRQLRTDGRQSGAAAHAHTTNTGAADSGRSGPPDAKLREGILADIAPTILELLGLPQPAAMTGKSLLAE